MIKSRSDCRGGAESGGIGSETQAPFLRFISALKAREASRRRGRHGAKVSYGDIQTPQPVCRKNGGPKRRARCGRGVYRRHSRGECPIESPGTVPSASIHARGDEMNFLSGQRRVEVSADPVGQGPRRPKGPALASKGVATTESSAASLGPRGAAPVLSSDWQGAALGWPLLSRFRARPEEPRQTQGSWPGRGRRRSSQARQTRF